MQIPEQVQVVVPFFLVEIAVQGYGAETVFSQESRQAVRPHLSIAENDGFIESFF